MKAIMIDNKILSLENVKEVHFHYNGTTTMKGVYEYFIIISYMNGADARSDAIPGKEKAKEWLNKIFEIITAE